MAIDTNPLRILFCVPTLWTETLGVPQVSIRLSSELAKRGHICHKFSFEDAFPHGLGRIQSFFQTGLFQRRLRDHIVQHGGNYDVIQAEHNMLPYRRPTYRFSGKLIAKSNGLFDFYRDFTESIERELRPQLKDTGTMGGNLLRSLGQFYGRRLNAADLSFEAADLIHLLNQFELDHLQRKGVHSGKLHIVSNGITAEKATILATSATLNARAKSKSIAFVGSWSLRKGLREFPQIVRSVRRLDPDVYFHLLGTGVNAENVRAEFDPEDRDALIIEPEFTPDQLTRLLSNCKCGLFPSYVEGFGLGVLEMLAAGLPVVAWDIPGPSEMIVQGKNGKLVKAGDIEATHSALIEILELPENRYRDMYAAALEVPNRFTWEKAADAFLGSLTS